MAEIINLRQARKSRRRDEKRRDADANAARHGRSRAETERDERDADAARRHVDGHKLETDE